MKQFIGENQYVDLLNHPTTAAALATQKISENQENEDAFCLGNFADIIAKNIKWHQYLPRVKPFYAVKCNDEYAVLKLLSDMGLSFDCASKAELEKVLNLGVDPSRIIYANPCKQTSYIKYAKKRDVDMMTFDNEAELLKIKAHFPTAQLVLRILPPSHFKVQCELGMKFGCLPGKAIILLEKAKELHLNVMGISFHVGSGCEEANAFAAAIEQARMVFNQAVHLGFNMRLLDIGGGFPGQKSAPISFDQIARVINESLTEFFPEEEITIIAEPGRFYVASAFAIFTNVIAKRTIARDQQTEDNEPMDFPTADDEPAYMYYVNDGVYGSFNCLLYDHANVVPLTFKVDSDGSFSSSIWGPTCDGLDCIAAECKMPYLDVGDWIYYLDMGAYTICSSSTFNGIPKPECHYYCSSDAWYSVYPSVDGKACNLMKMMKPIPAQPVPTKMLMARNIYEDDDDGFLSPEN